jgi:hypothetical protein
MGAAKVASQCCSQPDPQERGPKRCHALALPLRVDYFSVESETNFCISLQKLVYLLQS